MLPPDLEWRCCPSTTVKNVVAISNDSVLILPVRLFLQSHKEGTPRGESRCAFVVGPTRFCGLLERFGEFMFNFLLVPALQYSSRILILGLGR